MEIRGCDATGPTEGGWFNTPYEGSRVVNQITGSWRYLNGSWRELTHYPIIILIPIRGKEGIMLRLCILNLINRLSIRIMMHYLEIINQGSTLNTNMMEPPWTVYRGIGLHSTTMLLVLNYSFMGEGLTPPPTPPPSADHPTPTLIPSQCATSSYITMTNCSRGPPRVGPLEMIRFLKIKHSRKLSNIFPVSRIDMMINVALCTS